MKSSETITAIAPALAKAQAEIGVAIKDKKNPAFKSSYADLASITAAVKPALANHGLSFLQLIHDRQGAVCIETVILHASGEWISGGEFAIPVSKNDAHGTMSALTYCRRGSLAAAFGVPSDDDDGNAASAAPPPPVVLISMDQATQLDDMIKEVRADRAGFLRYLKVEKLEDLPAAHFEHAVKKLEAKRAQEAA